MAKLIQEKISRYENVIWDWNGTLLNDSKIGTAAEAEIFKRYGLRPQSHEERLRNFFMPIEKYYEKMGFDFSNLSFEKVSEEWLEVYERLASEAPLFEGIRDLLESNRSEGKHQFVLSAAPEIHLKDVLAKHSIHHYFDAVYGLPNAKADSKIERGLELIRDCKISPASTVLIGDTVHDFEVGQALGVDVLLVADGHHSYEALLDVHDNVLQTRFG